MFEKKIFLEKPKRERKNIKLTPNFENITILNKLYLNENIENYTIIQSEIRKKINGYKQQDIKKNIYNEKEFINYDELIEKLVESQLKCYYCKCSMELIYKFVRQPDQWSLERLNNNIGHTSGNTVISCLKCNLQRRNKNSNDFKFSKQMIIKKI